MSFNKKIGDTSVRLGPVRFSYVNVFAPRRNDDGTPGKYGVSILLPKTDTEALALLKAAYTAACTLGKVNKWNGRIPPKVAFPIHDGDEEKPDDPAYEGMWYFNASSTNAPGVRVREAGIISEALDGNDFYSGCYGVVSVNLFPYSNNGNVGVGIGLGNVMKTEDGTKLGGGRTAEEDFGDLV